jgi:hypothetical protein
LLFFFAIVYVVFCRLNFVKTSFVEYP